MKLCYFNDYRLGVIKGDNVVDVTDAAKDLPHRDTRDLIAGVIEHWDKYKSRLEAGANAGSSNVISPRGSFRNCPSSITGAWRSSSGTGCPAIHGIQSRHF